MPGKPILFTLVLWFALAASMIAHTALGGGPALTTDDAMRLTEVRDLLGGQNWFDVTQWRMNAPYGLTMHWSHLVDAAIATLMLLLRPFAGAHGAETAALYLWPVLLLLPAFIAVQRIAMRLAGQAGGLIALVLAATCLIGTEPFQPGSIDHHNVQLVLMLWTIVFLMEFDRWRWAPVVVACFACLSLAVGIETLPYVVLLLAVVCLRWAVSGAEIAPAARKFGLSFAATSVLLFACAIGSVFRLHPACDSFSGFYAALGTAGGCGLAAIVSLPRVTASITARGVWFAGLAVALVGLAVAINPVCLHGPYGAVDPRLDAIWLSRIAEAKTPFYFTHLDPTYFLAGYGYAVFASMAALAAIFAVRREKRIDTAIAAAFALMALAVTTAEVRGVAFAALFAIPGLAALIASALERFALPRAIGAVALIAALCLASDTAFAFVGGKLAKPDGPKPDQFAGDCLTPADYAQLASLPKGNVMGFVDQGPYILAYTGHAAVAGPYHRDAAGILDTYAFFTGKPADAAAIARRRAISYVAVCKPSPDDVYYRHKGGPHGLLSQLAVRHTIAWLEPLPVRGDAGTALYRVRRELLPQ